MSATATTSTTTATNTGSTAQPTMPGDGRDHAALADAVRRTPVWITAAIIAAVLITVGVVLGQPWFAPTDLVRDSQSVAALRGRSDPAYGIVSNLGIIVLLLAAGTALAAIAGAPRRGGAQRILAWSLALSLLFALDDLLLLHEATAFGPAPGIALAAAYGVGFLTFVVRFRATIVDRFDPALLIGTFVGLGVSAIVDVLVDPATSTSVVVEDGAKLLGLLAWSAFVMRAAIITLRGARPIVDRT
ncbi:hypothetical protein [Agromyces sp. GXS1127]|uniref:hypothetical protein n=1 Tax=Agromyces sp. GXS1127 TaxID=3424181 RepID=UPI003D31A1CB